MPKVLRRLRINEVSSVDRAANPHCVVRIVKRDGDPALMESGRMVLRKANGEEIGQSIIALSKSVAAVLVGDPADRDRELEETFDAFRAHYAGTTTKRAAPARVVKSLETLIAEYRARQGHSDDVAKGVEPMTTTLAKCADHEFSKALETAIEGRALTKGETYQAMVDRAAMLRQPGESIAQSFAKCYSGLDPRVPGGCELMALHKAAPNDKPRVVDGGYRRPGGDGGDDPDATLNGIISQIMTEQKVTRSRAHDLALRTPGGNAAYRQSLARSRAANAS